MREIRLPKRLAALADWIGGGERPADVGTDHAMLPIWLVQSGRVSRAAASDLRPGPLARAKANAEQYGVSDRISFALADGLDGTAPEETDTVVIAGLGGETIVSILARADWVRTKKLILQPRTKLPELRRWLIENGYAIEAEKLVYEQGVYYVCMLVFGGRQELPEEYGLELGPKLTESSDPLLAGYLEHVMERLERAAEGMKKSDRPDAGTLARHEQVLGALRELAGKIRSAEVERSYETGE